MGEYTYIADCQKNLIFKTESRVTGVY